jgi:enoyl-CoA hydratase/carnithine racemase
MIERKVTTYGVDRGVALLTLNRPDRLNAWTARMEYEYRAALAEADTDPEVRAVVITGSGRGFCAGADTEALKGIVETGKYGAGSGQPLPQPGAGVHKDFDHGFSFPLALTKPVIAAVNGPAAGVGFVVMCFADIRFAAAGAKLTTSFARLGLPAEHGVSWMLSRLIGPARAADLLFSSRVVLAEEALEIGLVNRVLPADELLDATLHYARQIATEISPWSLRTIKRQLALDLDRDLDASASEAEVRMRESFDQPDFTEGVAALREKRLPRFAP